MRVITGSAKGRRLQMVPGDSTRPITDRAKEALFSILGEWVIDIRVLDLFGGTGGIGIEVLSRGGAFAQFVDLNRQAVQTILANLGTCGLQDRARVERKDSFDFLKKYQGDAFDLIYIAPPQYQKMWSKALRQLDERPELLTEDGIIAVQIHPKEIHPKEHEPVVLANFEEFNRRKYGSVLIIFYEVSEARLDALEADAEGGS